ncbi:hypothetical protein FRC06_009741, partial [Ceratobasidium sp. 370]
VAESGIGDEVYDKIGNLQHLRSLTFSRTTVDKELLEVLGRFPPLETLTLHTDWAETWQSDRIPLDVPGGSFVLDEFVMSRVCKVPPLFRHLVTAVIIFDDQSFDEHEQYHSFERSNDPYVASRPVIEAFKYMSLRRLNLGEVNFDSGRARDEDDEDEEDEEDDEGNAGEDEGEETEGRDASAQNRPAKPGWEHLLSTVPELEEIYPK